MVTVPVLLVLVYRPEYLHAWADRTYHAQIALTRLPGASSAAMVRAILTKPYAARVPLERLTPEQSQAMVQDLLGVATLPPELERLIVAKTDGNPLFVEELTISLLESGDLVQEPAGYRLTRPLAALDIPATVQGVLLARIDRLREDLKSVLMKAYEFPCNGTSAGRLELPNALMKLLPANQVVQVIILLSEPAERAEEV